MRFHRFGQRFGQRGSACAILDEVHAAQARNPGNNFIQPVGSTWAMHTCRHQRGRAGQVQDGNDQRGFQMRVDRHGYAGGGTRPGAVQCLGQDGQHDGRDTGSTGRDAAEEIGSGSGFSQIRAERKSLGRRCAPVPRQCDHARLTGHKSGSMAEAFIRRATRQHDVRCHQFDRFDIGDAFDTPPDNWRSDLRALDPAAQPRH